MKSNLFTSILLLASTVCLAQTTIVLTPDATSGKDALLVNRTTQSGVNYGTEPDFASWAWTQSSTNTIARSLIDFDLSMIAPGAIITNATLSLYCNTTSAYTQLQSGTNASYLERVTTPWDENTVTWNSQPTTTPLNRVSLATSTTTTQNYLNINITQLMLDIQANPSSGFGLMLKLQSEAIYRAMIFGSSDHPDPLKRPRLQVTYLPAPASCLSSLVLQPNAMLGKDALIDSKSNNVNTNFGTSQDFAAWSWTIGGDSTKVRSIIQFDLTGVPANATINSARLSLYCNTSSAVTQLHSGLNQSYVERVIQPWKEDSVTWNNQPQTTTVNQVTLNESTFATQNYLLLDVTNLIVDTKNNPSTSFGLMLKLATELNYRSLVFASSDHSDSTKRPRLEICYTVPPVVYPIALNNLNGGEKILRNTVKRINWTSTNATANVSIQYSLNNGVNWNTITPMTKDTGFFDWSVPDSISTLCKIKVCSYETPTIGDTSDATFSISDPPTYTILAPNGGEVYYNDTLQQISWTGTNRNNAKIEYTLNDTNWYLVTASVNSSASSFVWLPSNLKSVKAKVRIVDNLFPRYGDTSNATFTYRPTPKFTCTYPVTTNEIWFSGVSKTITWSSSDSRLTKLECSINNGPWVLIADSLSPLVSSYAYTPAGLHKATLQFRLSDLDVPYKYYTSAVVKVFEKPVINILTPNGGEWLFTGTNQTIVWTSTYSDSVNLYYSVNGVSWSVIATNVNAANRTYQWQLPLLPANTYRVLVSDVRFTGVFDTTDALFSVRNLPQFTFISPGSGSRWLIGEEKTISWTSLNTRYTRIEYSVDSNVWIKLADSLLPSITSLKWVPVGTHKSTVRFRISDVDLPNTYVVSTPVKLYEKPSLSILSPNSGERIIKGSVYPITWSALYADTIDVYYSTNGVSWMPISFNVDATAGTLNWNVPLMNSNTVRLKIADTRFPLSSDTTDMIFKIITQPVINLVSPNGGEVWLNTGMYPITWFSSDVSKLTIAYSTNDSSWIPIATAVQANIGYYNWRLPLINNRNVKVKIIDEDFSSVYDMSSAPFFILSPPSVQVLTPNGGEQWYTDSTYNISWNAVNVPFVNVYYTTDDSVWIPVAVNLPSSNSVTVNPWVIPTTLVSTKVKVMVRSTADSLVSDKSDAPFRTSVFVRSGVGEIPLAKAGVLLYPNPTSGLFNIKNNQDQGAYKVFITDIGGKVVYKQIGITAADVSIQLGDHLNNGLYLVKIETENGAVVIQKLMLTK